MKIEFKLMRFKCQVLGMVLFLLFGYASVFAEQSQEMTVKRPISEFVKEDVTYAIDVYDPLEGFNRSMYMFNYRVDKYFFLPVVHGYEWITPDLVETGISNFFNNLTEVTNLTNALLQFKLNKATKTVGRFVINTILGVGGLLDVATGVGVLDQDEDFGQTLGVYGLGNGPYLVLPILGPSCLRDTGGVVVDSLTYTLMIEGIINNSDMDTSEENLARGAHRALHAVDLRHKQSFRYFQTGSPFEYEMVRLLYTTKREIQVEN
jgi:phospholipid-binding lipoprotein MlaA